MKKISCLTICCMMLYTQAFGLVVGFSGVGGGVTDLIPLITFEDPPYTDGEELVDAVGEGWTETASDTITAKTSTNFSFAGTQSAKIDTEFSGFIHVLQPFTEQTGIITLDMYVYPVNAATQNARFGICDGDPTTLSNLGLLLSIDTDDLFIYNGSAFTAVTTGDAMPSSAWYHIEVECDGPNGDYKIWVDGVQQGTTFSTTFVVTALDNFYFRMQGVGSSYYTDNLRVYLGARQ